MLDYKFQWRVVWRAWPALAEGAVVTIEITILSVLIGASIAMVLAVVRRSESWPLRAFAKTWVEIARNTPVLLQIYLAYFGLGAFHIQISAFAAVLGAVAFNNAGYLAEVFRGGLDMVSHRQLAAARSTGMTLLQAYRYIIFPQVLRIVFWPTTNQIIWAMLSSSLGMIIGLHELAGATAFQQSLTFRPFEFYLITACLYYLIAKFIILSARLIGWRLFRY